MTTSTPLIYNEYTTYLKKIYNERIQKITILAGLTCPNRDGTKGVGGCSYCNNRSFAPPTYLNKKSITDQINHGIKVSKRRYKKTTKYIVYFQEYSNTYAPLNHLKKLYQEALNHPNVIGLAIGTRPDCINKDILDYIASLTNNYDITIEYGVESIFDTTLKKINRCHNFQTSIDAIVETKKRGIKVCAHLILGFPWETMENIKESAIVLSKYPIDFLKIHQLHILKNTKLGEELSINTIKLFSKIEYFQALKTFLEYCSHKIVIQRIYGNSPAHLTLAPSWREEVSEFNKEFQTFMRKENSYQGKNSNNT